MIWPFLNWTKIFLILSPQQILLQRIYRSKEPYKYKWGRVQNTSIHHAACGQQNVDESCIIEQEIKAHNIICKWKCWLGKFTSFQYQWFEFKLRVVFYFCNPFNHIGLERFNKNDTFFWFQIKKSFKASIQSYLRNRYT